MPVDAQVANVQRLDVQVAGPDGANRLIIITGGFDSLVMANSRGVEPQDVLTVTETYSALIGPVLTQPQFRRAIATASFNKINFQSMNISPQASSWQIRDVDADWDDESGQVELRVEISATSSGLNNLIHVAGIVFQVTILAAIAA